eukprot:3666689-Ditylum_brightwellii.AAC.2
MMAPGLSKAETSTFFLNVSLMDVNLKTFTKLGKEGIVKVEDLGEFNKTMWKQVADNLQHPNGQTKNPDKGLDKGSTVPQSPVVFGAKM